MSTARVSRGCLPCRTRKVKCDESRPACRRCVKREEVCAGYRDDTALLFRNENVKIEQRYGRPRRRSSSQNVPRSSPSWSSSASQASSSGGFSHPRLDDDSTNLTLLEATALNMPQPFPWAKEVPNAYVPSPEDQAVTRYFEKTVLYPCNDGSSPGFLEHLPALFNEFPSEGRYALRWAVRAAAYASQSNEQKNITLGDKALKCYGMALKALGRSLADPKEPPNDYDLMTVVVLDIFETMHLQDWVSAGCHAEGMAQILRLRGPDQIYGARGWSLFRLSHHRLLKQQLAFRQPSLPESEAWFDLLNETDSGVHGEKDSYEISKICQQGRELWKKVGDTNVAIKDTLEMIRKMHELDLVTTTWRNTPHWVFKTVTIPAHIREEEPSVFLPEVIQIQRDVWMAYEWNYHRTARIIMHEHLLECLDRLRKLYEESDETTLPNLFALEKTSRNIIRSLIDEVLSTVPQSLGDVDDNGNVIRTSSQRPTCVGIGGYFLLWPIKILKASRSATEPQRIIGQGVFERIREFTGMKSALGDASII